MKTTTLIVKQDFSWAHRGVEVIEYVKGDEVVTDDADLIAVAKAEGWAEEKSTTKKATVMVGDAKNSILKKAKNLFK